MYILFLLLVVGATGCQANRKNNREDSTKKDKAAPVGLIILGGQSNMVGAGQKKEIGDKEISDHITYYNFGKSSKLVPASDSSFGPELGICEELSAHFPHREFVLVKYAVGGSSMYDWAVDYDPEKVTTMGTPEFGKLYDSLIYHTRKTIKGKKVEPVALVWMQGETDARFTAAGKDYYTGFQKLISNIRKDMGQQDLPVLYGRINPVTERYPGAELVQKAQEKIEQDVAYTYMISTDGLDKKHDELHYSSQGQIELGHRFGKVLTDLIKEGN
ncbi:sialate O-acetylesterase [Sinomicrobium weinanense]|uniref:sialate O-acetylesterase n=1 Tax=Sinomicrobium weinanense TaxID=2842200 RepID=UPI001CAA7C60|nr:sialate O-acetylesterase [Sinomicrobium weinanense]